MANFFSRDTKVYLVKDSTIWEIPVLEDYDYDQDTELTEVELNEAATPAGVSRRGRRAFTDAYNPATFSFSTYIRPFAAAGGGGTGAADSASAYQHAIEEALWACFVGSGAYSAYTFTNLTADATDLDISWEGSNTINLGVFDLYFVLGANNAADADYTAGSGLKIDKVEGCVLDNARISFDVNGIAMIEWSGLGKLITSPASFDASAAITEGISSTTNYIKNKLTSLSVTADDATSYPGAGGGVYNMVLTGGEIEFSNNIEFLTPQTIGSVNTPFAAIPGAKSVTGNFTCYLDTGTNGDSGDLIEDLGSDTDTITNSFDIKFVIGGTGNTPRMEINLPTAHLQIPTVSIEDIVSVDVAFQGIPSTISTADEASIKYVGE